MPGSNPVPNSVNVAPLRSKVDDHRPEFLLEIYRQTSTHIGRHIVGVWQCVGVVGAALVVFALDKDKPLNDYACTLVVVLCGWLFATTLDASNWFNRNLAIVTNIERLFLSRADLTLVHPFFGKHRTPGRHAKHFSIQFWLAGAVGILVLIYHLVERVLPGISLPWSYFQLARALPYSAAVAVSVAVSLLGRYYKKRDASFRRAAPGLSM